MSAVLKRLRIQGLIVSDSWQRLPGWQAMAIPHIGSGAPRDRENIVQGIENAPAAWSGSAPKLWHVGAKVSR
jgi:NADPH-dependent curcumin reductase CurA